MIINAKNVRDWRDAEGALMSLRSTRALQWVATEIWLLNGVDLPSRVDFSDPIGAHVARNMVTAVTREMPNGGPAAITHAVANYKARLMQPWKEKR